MALAPGLLRGATGETTVINVGVSSQEPFVSLARGGAEVSGLLPDILKYTAAQKGWQIRYTAGSPASNTMRLEQGSLDLVIPAPWPSSRIGQQDFTSEGAVSSWGQLYTAKSISVLAISDLAGTTIAVLKDDPHYERFKTMLAAARVRCEFVEMDSYQQILESLDRRSTDAGLVDRFFGERNANRYHATVAPIASPSIEFRFAARRNRGGILIESLDYWQSRLKSDRKSLYHRFFKDWGGHDDGYKPTLLGFLTIALLLTGGTVYGLIRIRRAEAARTARLITVQNELIRAFEAAQHGEQTAEAQKNWYQLLLNSTEDVILIHGLDARNKPTKFLEANHTACRRLGYTRGELLSLAPQDIEVMADTGSQQPYAPLLKNPSLPHEPADGTGSIAPCVSSERVYRTKSAREIPMEVTIRILEYDGRPVVYCCAHDVTLRHETQSALRESERRFLDFFARSPIGIVLYDMHQQLTDVNPAALGMFGVSDRSHFVAPTLAGLPEISEESMRTLLNGTVRYEAVMDFDLAKESGSTQYTRSGKSSFDILVANLGLDKDFKPKGFLVMLQDITERRRAEESLRQNERLLRQAHKMEAIGTLAGGIAHDFNNILTPIIGYTEIALHASPAGDPIRGSLEEVLKASHRARDLVRQILAFSRQSESEAKPIGLISVIKEVMTLQRGSIRPDIQLQTSIKTDSDIVRADQTQLHQVLMNLGTNALHAMRRTGGILEYGLNKIVLDGRARGPLAKLNRGTYADLTVRDTGTGMDRATLDHIFEPFFTTKKHGEGTGMGLAVAHGIIASLHGTITVESEVGKGTTFHVVLPLEEKAGAHTAVPSEPVPRGTEQVLCVDDEPEIVNMIAKMLKNLGYIPVTCIQGHEALALIREAPNRFALLITDQVMPGMTGLELVHEAHHIRPDLPVLLCTGFSKKVSEQDLLDGGVSEIILKPILLRQIAEAMRRTIDRKPRPSKPS
jgi:PAS domain S-box-containing protein